MKKQTTQFNIFRGTKPLTKYEHDKIDKLMNRELNKAMGHSTTFQFKVGDTVKDNNGGIEILTIKERYRENGHNKYATNKYFHRECDLVLA